MPINDKLQSKLIRILRAETADHPRMGEAVKEARGELEAIVWTSGHKPDNYGADGFADRLEDWLGYHGEPLPDEIAEGWRQTCRRGLQKAMTECAR